MTSKTIKRMLDACYQAKRAREMLPPLPKGVLPSYIQYLEVIQILEKEKHQVKVSDISDALSIPRPGVTRTVKEMEAKGYLRKLTSRRMDGLRIFPSQRPEVQLSQKYDEQYFSELASDMNDISESDAEVMIRTIEKFYQIMCERRNRYDK